jgi:hypothetical protein
VAAAPQPVLAAGGRRRDALGADLPPHPGTVVRIFTALGAQALAGHAGAFLVSRRSPARPPSPGRRAGPTAGDLGRRQGGAWRDR